MQWFCGKGDYPFKVNGTCSGDFLTCKSRSNIPILRPLHYFFSQTVFSIRGYLNSSWGCTNTNTMSHHKLLHKLHLKTCLTYIFNQPVHPRAEWEEGPQCPPGCRRCEKCYECKSISEYVILYIPWFILSLRIHEFDDCWKFENTIEVCFFDLTWRLKCFVDYSK